MGDSGPEAMLADAELYTKSARRMRAISDVERCVEYGTEARRLALLAHDEAHPLDTGLSQRASCTLWAATTAVGRMYSNREEWADAYRWFRLSLSDCEMTENTICLSRSLAWCASVRHMLDGRPSSEFGEHARRRMDRWTQRGEDERLWAFIFDMAQIRVPFGGDPAYMYSAARAASFHAEPGALQTHLDETYKLDLMAIFATQAEAAGLLRDAARFGRAFRRWEIAHTDKGDDEALPVCLLSIAAGARSLGEVVIARDCAYKARRSAEVREEPVLQAKAHCMLQEMEP